MLGEVDKIVGVSAVRFQSIGVHWLNAGAVGGGSCVAFEVSLVAADEVITVAAVSPRGIYLTQDIRQQHGSICEQRKTPGPAGAPQLKTDDSVRPTLGNEQKQQPPPGGEQKRQPPSVGVPGQYPVPKFRTASYGYGLSCTKSPTPSRCGWNVSASQRTPYANRSLDLYIAAPAVNSSTGTSAANASLRPALVCIHGGSYSGGYALNGAEHCGAALAFFASAGWVVFAIDYRLRSKATSRQAGQ